MRKTLFILFFTAALVSAILAEGKSWYDEAHEGVLFHLGFDRKSVFASRAVGDPNAKVFGKPLFVPGIKGLGVLSDKKTVKMHYAVKDNLTFEKPGSIAIWIKAVDWRKPSEQPKDRAGHRVRIYQPFFMTAYRKAGYLGLQRMTSHLPGKKDYFSLFVAGFEGVQGGFHHQHNLDNGKWRYLVLTWDPLVFRLYVDGTQVAHCSLQKKIMDSLLPPRFIVYSPGRTVIDEFFIYKYALTPEAVAKFYKYYRMQTD